VTQFFPKTEHAKNPYDSALAGSLAGLVSRMVVSPLDVIKIRWQLNSQKVSLTTTLRNILTSQGGIPGLFRGNTWGLGLWIGYSAVQFPVYERVKIVLGENNYARIIAGSVAAGVATLTTYPLDVMRTRKIATTTHDFRNIFRGIGPGLAAIIPMAGTTFAIHEKLHELGVQKAVSGMIAGMTARTMFFPLDTIKRRMMAQGFQHVESGKTLPSYSNAYYCAKHIFQEGGFFSFFRGMSPSLLKTGLGSSVTFYVYETVIHTLNGR
jgi:solute carrier family 25 thiamine pyrophosphate transporter 19